MSHREEAPGKDPGHTGETMSLSWPGQRSQNPPERAGGSVWGEGSLGISAQTAASATRSQIKRMKMDGWMDVQPALTLIPVSSPSSCQLVHCSKKILDMDSQTTNIFK
ncbi:hypothetical protein L3Q82_005889 [Scortum barcoo]|uniref:Uncharacterized protein n=1 Tax=Scortum barcoo TaxID=214431 RepID=A0ACB8V717_9TELE|nr:hypothetical protein L3Q82_005889 [Scortum barcoo]